MSDMRLPLQAQITQLQRENERLRANQIGPTLGEFYSMLRGAPGVRGVWLPGSIDNTGAMFDASGQGRTLTYNGNPTLAVLTNGVPYMDYDGAGDYHSRADEAGLDITGTETTIAAASRGLTIGGVYWTDVSAAATVYGLLAKQAAAGNRSYALVQGNGVSTCWRGQVSGDGTALIAVESTVAVVTGTWVFLVVRYTPSTELAIWVNGTKTANTTSIPAAIFNSNAAFTIGNLSAAANPMDGRCAAGWAAAALWDDALINNYTARAKPIFGI